MARKGFLPPDAADTVAAEAAPETNRTETETRRVRAAEKQWAGCVLNGPGTTATQPGNMPTNHIGDGGIGGTALIFFYRPSLNLRLSLDYEHFNDI